MPRLGADVPLAAPVPAWPGGMLPCGPVTGTRDVGPFWPEPAAGSCVAALRGSPDVAGAGGRVGGPGRGPVATGVGPRTPGRAEGGELGAFGTPKGVRVSRAGGAATESKAVRTAASCGPASTLPPTASRSPAAGVTDMDGDPPLSGPGAKGLEPSPPRGAGTPGGFGGRKLGSLALRRSVVVTV